MAWVWAVVFWSAGGLPSHAAPDLALAQALSQAQLQSVLPTPPPPKKIPFRRHGLRKRYFLPESEETSVGCSALAAVGPFCFPHAFPSNGRSVRYLLSPSDSGPSERLPLLKC